MIQELLFIGSAKAQELLQCPDGTTADSAIGCVSAPPALVNPESGILILLSKAGSTVMTIAAGLATVFLIYGGIQYALAAGDENQIQKAKRTMFWSVAGLIIALLARSVAQFILNIIT